jgi:hypothetical protein
VASGYLIGDVSAVDLVVELPVSVSMCAAMPSDRSYQLLEGTSVSGVLPPPYVLFAAMRFRGAGIGGAAGRRGERIPRPYDKGDCQEFLVRRAG